MAHGGGDEEAEVNLTPLLDVVLQLIMFFMITVNFVRVDQLNEEVKLPGAQQAVPMDKTADNWVFLNMNKDGKLLVSSGEDLDIKKPNVLKVFVERERANLVRDARSRGRNEDIRVVIVLRADARCWYRDVWEVLDLCNKAGYQKWQLARHAPEGMIQAHGLQSVGLRREPNAMYSHRKKREEPGGVNLSLIITPMLDMAFQLMAFFIMTYHPSALEAHIDGTLMPPEKVAIFNPKTPINPKDEPPPATDLEPDLKETIQVKVEAVARGQIEGLLTGGMPRKVSVKQPDGKEQTVAVSDAWEIRRLEGEKDGAYQRRVDEKFQTALKGLTSKLKELQKESATTLSCNIVADGDLRYSYFIQVQDACKGANFKSIGFTAPQGK